MQPNTLLQPEPQNADSRNLDLDLDAERNALLFPTQQQPANDGTAPKSKNTPSPRTLLNEAVRQYIEVLQQAVAQDSAIAIQKVTKPKIEYWRGEGWYIVRRDNKQRIFIGESSERAIKYWQKRILALKKRFGLEAEVQQAR